MQDLLKNALACFETAIRLDPDNRDAQRYYQQSEECLAQEKTEEINDSES